MVDPETLAQMNGNLDALIASKEAIARERDLAALRHLRAIKQKLEKQDPSNRN